MDNIEVNIKKIDIDWREIRNLCRTTIGKGDLSTEPSDEWIKKILIAEHSPIRHSLITVEIKNIPYAYMGHLVRHHVGVTPYVQTSRSDRTGVDRGQKSQLDTVDMCLDLNIQSLINISRKRLCLQASAETRYIWDLVIEKIRECEPLIADICVPQCVSYGGCIETFSDCNYYEGIMKDTTREEQMDVVKRYNIYNSRRKRNKI